MIKFNLKNSLILFFLLITNYCLLIPQALAATPPIPSVVFLFPSVSPLSSTSPSDKTTNLGSVIEDQGFFQTDIGTFISKGITAIISVAALLCLGYMLWGAIDWLTSEGDKDKYTSARNKILHAVMGLAIVVTVWAIWQLILFFLGLNKIFGL